MASKRFNAISDPDAPGFTQQTLFSPNESQAAKRYNPYPRLVATDSDIREIIHRGAAEGKIGCDLEFNDNRITIFGAACRDTAGATRWHDGLANEILEVAEKSGAVIVGHSTIGAEKFQFEKHLGHKTDVKLYGCSMIGHHLVNGDMTKLAGKEEGEEAGSLGLMGLQTLTALDTDLPHYKDCRGKYCQSAGPSPCPTHRVFDYCAVDAWASLEASYKQDKEMARLGVPQAFYRDCIELTEICVDMETAGLRIDREWVKVMDKRGSEFKVHLFPFETVNNKPVYNQFNPKSSQHILKYCTEKGISLKDTTKDEIAKVLEKAAKKEGIFGENIKVLCDQLEQAPELSENLDTLYRLYQYKNAGKGVKSWFDEKYYGKDGRIHPRFITTGTCTGRLSSSKPNFTNIGARGWAKELKKAVIPDEGMDFVESDWSQLELRIILYLAGYDVSSVGSDAFLWLVQNSGNSFDKAAVTMAMSARDVGKSVSHGCLTADHEVLTPSGWIPIDKWEGQDIATWATTGEVAFAQPLRYIQTEADETIELSGTAISQRVTKDHKFPVFSQGTWKGKSYKTWHTRTTQELEKMRLPLCGDHNSNAVYSTEDLQRAIAIQADGSKCKNWPGWWKFHVKRPRKVKRIAELFGVDLPLRKDGAFSGCVNFSSPLLSDTKQLTWEFLNTTADQKRACVEESTLWDGTRGKTTRVYMGADTQSMCVLQTLAALSNQQGLWRVGGPGGYPGSTKIVNKLSYNVRKYADIARIDKREIQESVKVFCFTTTSGYFMVRRNNTISVTGNSDYLEGIQVKTGEELESPRMKHEIEIGARIVYTKRNFPQLKRDWEYRGGLVTFTGANMAERIFGDKSLANRRKAHGIIEGVYFKQFFAIRQWQMSVLEQAETGLVKSPSGRVLKLYGSPEDDAKMAVAFLGQGLGGDHARSVMLKRKREEGVIPVLMVHDSLVQQVPKEWTDAQARALMASMQLETPLLPGFVNPGKIRRGPNYGDIQLI